MTIMMRVALLIVLTIVNLPGCVEPVGNAEPREGKADQELSGFCNAPLYTRCRPDDDVSWFCNGSCAPYGGYCPSYDSSEYRYCQTDAYGHPCPGSACTDPSPGCGIDGLPHGYHYCTLGDPE